jgi:Mn-dependent DtxR family transcriptional regulator
MKGEPVMRIQESGEMYLETILRLSQKSGHVRAIDVSEEMGYSKPSVSRAMSLLKEGGYIVIDRDGAITLTDAGREIAEKIYARHTLLTNFLVSLGVDEKTAAEDACKMEHSISDISFEAIQRLLEKNNVL